MENGENQRTDGLQQSCGSFFTSIWRHLAPVLLFIFLPILLGAYLGYHTIQIEKQKHIELLGKNLETQLTQFSCEVDSDTFLKKVARGSFYQLMTIGGKPEAFAAYYKALQNFLPIEFDLYAFDQRGSMVTPASAPLRSKFLASKLWEIIRCAPIEQNKRFHKIKRPLRSFLGDEFRMSQFLEGRDSCLPLMVRHRNGCLYWFNDPAAPARGILMIFWDIPDEELRIRKTAARLTSNFAAGFSAKNEESLEQYGTAVLAAPEASRIFRDIALLKENSTFDTHERLWSGKKIGSTWLCYSLQANVSRFTTAQNLLIGMLLLLFSIAILIYSWAARSKVLFVSIRIKLMVLFLTAVASPIMGFVYLGYRYLDDRQQNLHAEVANQSRKHLFTLDESFKEVGYNFLGDFLSLSRRVATAVDDDFNRDVLARIEANELISIELRDTANAEISYFVQNEMYFEGMREVSDAFSRFCIDNVLGSKLADAVDPILDLVVRSPEAGLNFFFNRPAEVHKMEFGPVPLFIFWDLFRNSENKQVYVYIVQSANRLLHQLISRRLKTAVVGNSNQPFVLVASHRKTEEWLPFKVKSAHGLKDFSSRVFFSDQPVETLIEIKGQNYILTGQKGKNARDYAFYAFYPIKIIEDDISRQRRMIFAGILLFIVVALLTGWLLSDIFLIPVARLSEGVVAIKSRNHSFRIEATQKDEFGDLALSFNRMIEDLKEMQLARDVQESLLPSVVPVIPGYEVSFANRMASDVGGDYFDIHILDKQRVCVVIGDVTGHGVSSALVMAMARAIFYQGLKEGGDLISLFTDLNLAIYEYFHLPPVRKMITVFAAVIDLSTGIGEFVNAGHNFPVKLSAEGLCEELAAVHLPIGACRKLRNLTTNEFCFKSGETLVFYTDGLVEVKNSHDEMYGYDRFKDSLACNDQKSANDLNRELIARYDSWLGGIEPDDDLTLIVLKRLQS